MEWLHLCIWRCGTVWMVWCLYTSLFVRGMMFIVERDEWSIFNTRYSYDLLSYADVKLVV
jgi:hypothetical protein